MRLLLDTHVLLWWPENNPRLGSQARAEIAAATNRVFVSAASGWEIAIKRALGTLEAPAGWAAIVTEKGFTHLPISITHAEHAGALPPHHRDPFDRMLIAQAQIEGLELVSANPRLARYGVKLLAANV
ncbi:MAG TPA: type II toxin-antitoxin system VapC family toxin [Gammaproteobacteria bacterium]|nr:type II toxin-antitoxin system VapC family toxin [Gammaproteobacteria bacterium]